MTISLQEQSYLANKDEVFRSRIASALTDQAVTKYQATPLLDANDQAKRMAFIIDIIQDINRVLTPYARVLVTRAAIENAANIDAITDANIEAAMGGIFDDFAKIIKTPPPTVT